MSDNCVNSFGSICFTLTVGNAGDQKPPRKRPRTAGEKKKRVRWTPKPGKLRGVLELPIDVLYYIFGSLEPMDVLQLARVNKQFRGMLMHRSAMSIWKSAFQNIPDMPECPPYLCMPQWAHLCFYPHCTACNRPKIRTVDWELGVRLCKYCAKEQIIAMHEFVTRDGCNSLTSEFNDNFNYFEDLVPTRFNAKGHYVFFAPDLQAIQAKLMALPPGEERENYIDQRRQVVLQMKEHGSQCKQWASGNSRERWDVLHGLRKKRIDAIMQKLRDLGWEDEMNKIDTAYEEPLEHHPLFKEPKELTPRIWKNIAPKIVEHLKKLRANRIERDRRRVVTNRKPLAVKLLTAYKEVHAESTEVMPEAYDFCEIPAIKAILTQPSDVEVDASSFKDLDVHGLIEEWRAKINSELIDHLVEILSDDEDTKLTREEATKQLHLATNVFKCPSDCSFSFADLSTLLFPSDPLFYPELLAHKCFTKRAAAPGDADFLSTVRFIRDDTAELAFYPHARRRWSCAGLQVDNFLSTIAAGVVEAAGLDPEEATVEDMNRMNLHCVCLTCLKKNLKIGAGSPVHRMGWRNAIRHEAARHRGDVVEWLAVEGEHPLPAFPVSLREHEKIWMCARCRDTPRETQMEPLDDIQMHLYINHQIKSPELHADYYPRPDYPRYYTKELPYDGRTDVPGSGSSVDDDFF